MTATAFVLGVGLRLPTGWSFSLQRPEFFQSNRTRLFARDDLSQAGSSLLILDDIEVKEDVANRQDYGKWISDAAIHLDDLPDRESNLPRQEPLRLRQLAFGYTQEDLRMVIAPMAAAGEEPTASMGNDAALAVLSEKSVLPGGVHA